MQPMTARAASTITLSEHSTGAELHVGDRLEVRLSAQLGSGWSWQPPASVGPTLRLVGNTQTTGGTPSEGGTDLQVFAFEAAARGAFDLVFVYVRPFVSGDPPKKRASYRIQVR